MVQWEVETCTSAGQNRFDALDDDGSNFDVCDQPISATQSFYFVQAYVRFVTKSMKRFALVHRLN